MGRCRKKLRIPAEKPGEALAELNRLSLLWCRVAVCSTGWPRNFYMLCFSRICFAFMPKSLSLSLSFDKDVDVDLFDITIHAFIHDG